MGRVIADGETGMILPASDAPPWTAALALLGADAEQRQRMSRAARRQAERALPSWADVLAEDLLPRWQQAAGLRTRREASAAA
jgi:glycosyltransferase involved in cell wall biosynthesis